MIQLSDYLTTQKPYVNELVSKFISKRLYDIIEPMTDYDIEGLKHFFPVRYRHKKMLPVINDFCSLLKSENFYPLPLIMKYVLFKALLEEISHCEKSIFQPFQLFRSMMKSKKFYKKIVMNLSSNRLTNFLYL